MPTLTGTLHDVTGVELVPSMIRRLFVKAPAERASVDDPDTLIVSAPVDLARSGILSVALEPGPAVLVVDTYAGGPNTYELHVTADMTLLSEALAESMPDRSWVESVMVQLRTEAVAAAGAAGEDRVQTGLDRVATGEDRAQTGLDRVATGEDRVATGEDRTQTGLDRVAAAGSASDASTARSDVRWIRDEEVFPARDAAAGSASAASGSAAAAGGHAGRAEAAANEFDLTASSSTLAPGAAATVTVSGDGPAYSLAFGVPQGPKGDKGDEGEISQAQLDAAVASLVDNAPEALNTLSELSTALGNDPNFATTTATAIGERAKTSDVNAALAGKADVGHKHPVADLTTTGTASSSTYLRGDGSWQTPTNTTYSVPTQAEAEAGTATTARAFSAQRVRQAVDARAVTRQGSTQGLWIGTAANLPATGTAGVLYVTYE